ncbi:glyoxylase-like metal-dependent hydrolase (beta-lactamase superfamily II) [Dyadobacter jejuensis]|uniref:Glyoxylase-like metal-dependent hydrolase (Beta-lactamase superfamily II) n=1 Tax=Dyadobacter jejuensis TaxID=1082580 RepID=A0A316APK9_9BACT|nr:MBL fold metallo-hydrolase [Dyadobacter jejuensis]PWJ58760.1 glyoxylase-like metal-dependent hydrolase (beta-lactamase superfamily II) [Dyadobacter jejuensis]
MLSIQSFTFNPFGENTYVLYDETQQAVIVDPGCYDKKEFETLYSFITDHQLIPQQIINTHAHIDHVLGVAAVKAKYNIPFLLHRDDEPLLRAVKTYASNYGFAQFDEPSIDAYLEIGEEVAFGNTRLEVRFVPGHAPGHVAFIDHPSHTVIGGDVLFRQSIGRTDLPGGDMNTLLMSIRKQLFTLPDDYTVYAGHMEPTTIGFEKKHNPFLK